MALIAALAVASALHWIVFFDAGDFDMSVSDWPRQTAYFGVLREAVLTARLPLETSEPIYEMGKRFFANLAAPLSPQLWLFVLAGSNVAAVLNAVFMSWIGVYGCVRLARRLDLSAVSWAAMTLLLGVNGYVVAHVGAGHHAWLACALLPFWIEAMLCLSSMPGGSRRAEVAAGAVLFAMFLQGAIHIALISAGLLALAATLTPALRLSALRSLVWGAGLSAIRLVPAVFAFTVRERSAIWDGYPSPLHALEGLLMLRSPSGFVHVGESFVFGGHAPSALPAHEFDVYVGIVGVILIASFGIAPIARHLGPAPAAESSFVPWQFPLLVVAVLSCWRFYAALVPAPIGWLTVERVPSRFLGVVLAFAVVMACARFDAWWRSRPRSVADQALLWSVVAALGAQLLYHSWTFSPARRRAFAVTLAPIAPAITGTSSRTYLAAVMIGALITVACAAGAWAAGKKSRVGSSRCAMES